MLNETGEKILWNIIFGIAFLFGLTNLAGSIIAYSVITYHFHSFDAKVIVDLATSTTMVGLAFTYLLPRKKHA